MRRLMMHGLIVSLSASVGAADLIVVSEMKIEGREKKPSPTTQYISGAKLRTAEGYGDVTDTILFRESGKLLLVDQKEKSYYETTIEETRATFKKQSEQLQLIFGDLTLSKLEGAKKIAGYDCEGYELSIGVPRPRFNFAKLVVWVAPSLEVPHQYYDARKVRFSENVLLGPPFDRMFEALKRIKGFPLYVAWELEMVMVGFSNVSEATEVSTERVPAGTFDVPAGYKKVDSPYTKTLRDKK